SAPTSRAAPRTAGRGRRGDPGAGDVALSLSQVTSHGDGAPERPDEPSRGDPPLCGEREAAPGRAGAVWAMDREGESDRAGEARTRTPTGLPAGPGPGGGCGAAAGRLGRAAAVSAPRAAGTVPPGAVQRTKWIGGSGQGNAPVAGGDNRG